MWGLGGLLVVKAVDMSPPQGMFVIPLVEISFIFGYHSGFLSQLTA